MNHETPDDDPQLTRLLRAVHAEAEPALWTRVRARAEARPAAATGLLAWAMRPAALATSLALLIGTAAVALTLGVSNTTASGEDYATLSEALLAERDAQVTAPASPASGAEQSDGAARDSGSLQ